MRQYPYWIDQPRLNSRGEPVAQQPPLIRTQSLSAKEKAELWRAADTLRGHMDAAEYKHVVLGLIFLK